jgi:hypothetical protein
MYSSPIDSIHQLSYRQIQKELRKRQLDSSGKKNEIVKRFKIVYENEIKSMLIDIHMDGRYLFILKD